MILQRSSILGYFLVGVVLFLSCEANKGDDNKRLFLYMRSGKLRETDRSYQIAKQFGIERNGNLLRIRSNGTSQHSSTKDESTSAAATAHKENYGSQKHAGSSSSGRNSSSAVRETEIIVSAFMPLAAVTQENRSQPPRLHPPKTSAKRPNVAPESNISVKSDDSGKNSPVPKQPAFSKVASSTTTEDVTSDESEVPSASSPTSAETASTKVVSAPPTPEFQMLSECGCKRNFYYSLDDFTGSKLNSSCSDEGTQYTPGQKVVSFSLPRSTSPGDYNRTSSYKPNIIENLHRMRHFYPGYSMRIYTDLSLDTTYCRFLCQNTDLFWCDIRNTIGGDQSKMLHATWKFLPLGDPSVQLFLSRDISSFINEREAAVVEDWLTMNKTFHLMRDKRRVHNIAMLGGLWGARNDLLLADEGEKLRAQIIPMSKAPRNKGYRLKNFDQDILSRVIFYPRKRDIVAYDSYHCKQWKKFTMIRPFPVKRNETLLLDGVGTRGSASSAVAAIKKKYKLTKCPMECRPSYGKDWDYC